MRVPPVRTGETPSPAARTAGAARAGAKLADPVRGRRPVALDKPAGLAVHGGSGIAHGVIEQLRAARPEARFLELVHRLDRETSGVLLVAKKRAALVALHDAAARRRRRQALPVLVRGRWRDAKRVVRAAACTSSSTHEGERRVRVEDDGQEAQTIVPARGDVAATAIRRSRCSRPSSTPGARTRSACT